MGQAINGSSCRWVKLSMGQAMYQGRMRKVDLPIDKLPNPARNARLFGRS